MFWNKIKKQIALKSERDRNGREGKEGVQDEVFKFVGNFKERKLGL